ncbi:MAG: calcineurin-like phosphoesterase C-terminal domain-containing protein [Bacteroidales bacterium]|nr:calcineurin-like phosphoesterase C-terminal domain-containing protein [Bacteroidales bacterium]
MKRYNSIIALALFAAGCQVTPVADEPAEGELVLEIGLPSDSKTYIGPSVGGKRQIYWRNGDVLALNGVASDALSGIPDESTTATFRFEGEFSAPYNVLYPDWMYKDASTITLPQEQAFCRGGIGDDVAPMAAQLSSISAGGSLKHICAFIGLKVLKGTASDAPSVLSALMLSTPDSRQLSGDFTLNYADAVISGVDQRSETTYICMNPDEPLSETEPVELVLTVPAGEYANGFQVKLFDDGGVVLTMTRSASIDLEAGKLYWMPQFALQHSDEPVEFGLPEVDVDKLILDPYNVTGKVTDSNGNGLEGVVVSDGLHCTRTFYDGSFYLQCDPVSTRFIFVSTPSGYMPPVESGLPRFYKKLSSVTPAGGVYNMGTFALNAVDNPERYTLLMTADPQPRKSNWTLDKTAFHSLDICEDLYQELADVAAGISGRQVYGICLGDIVHENMSLFTNYRNGLAKTGFPTYNVIGNHDNDPSATDDDGGALPFEDMFGPRNYSFNLGKIHFVVLDDLIMKKDSGNDNKLTAYDQGLTDEVWEWLCADLSYIPTSTKLMVCAHSPMFKLLSGSERSNTSKHGPDYGDLINNYAEVHAWAGHSHVGFNYIYPEDHRHRRVQVHTLARSTGELWTNEYLAGGTPRGFTIVEVDGEEITWRFHPTRYERPDWIGASTGYTSSRPSYPSKDWTISGGKAYMKAGGAPLDESYQMHAYPRGAYGDNYVYANIFLWDEKWGLPVFTPDGGEPVEMECWTAAGRYDLADYEMRTHYKTYSNLLKGYSGYKTVDTDPITTLFRTTTEVGASPNSGTVSVTDRFGNTYTRPVSW